MALPPRCVASGEVVEKTGMLAPHVWKSLDFIAAPFCATCGFPFDFAAEAAMTCTECLSKPPPYASARAVLRYNDGARDIILGFKHGDKTHAVQTFLPWLRRAGADMTAQADVIIPVPLHRWRLLYRRYNQAALLAQILARDSGKRYCPNVLQRVRATPTQGYLKRKERARNVHRAFAISPRRQAQIAGVRVVLVDDVLTTGATVCECAKVLMKAGAARVDVLTLARVVK